MTDVDLAALSDDELAELHHRLTFEQQVRSCISPPCLSFAGLGPPWYAAPCRLPGGHDGLCDFGTLEEAGAAYEAGMRARLEGIEAAQAEAKRRCA